MAERQSARMSKITSDGLTLSGRGCFIAVPTRQEWASKGYIRGVYSAERVCVHVVKWCSVVISSSSSSSSSRALWNVLETQSHGQVHHLQRLRSFNDVINHLASTDLLVLGSCTSTPSLHMNRHDQQLQTSCLHHNVQNQKTNVFLVFLWTLPHHRRSRFSGSVSRLTSFGVLTLT